MNDRNKLLFGLFLFLATLAYGVYQWNERGSLLVQTEQLGTQAANLTSISETLTNDYQNIKVSVNVSREITSQELDVVFPTEEDLTTLTRLLDTFAVTNNFESNPFFINSITYQNVLSAENGAYRYVPLDLDLTTSKKNLNKFLETIENSGSLEGGVRLMSVERLSIRYPEEFGGTYEVQLTIHAYFSQAL